MEAVIETIGEILEDGTIIKGYSDQGMIYKNWTAFESKTDEVCYVPEYSTDSTFDIEEVDEEEFFYSRETGGTVVSTALELMNKVVKDRYPSDSWNIYAAQASDGENWGDDSPRCHDLIVKNIMPLVQYFAYVEISSSNTNDLWQTYEPIPERFPERFAMRRVTGPADIYPVFRELFERKSS